MSLRTINRRMDLLSVGTNAKTRKGDAQYMTAILYLAPATTVDGLNLCPMSVVAGCRDACLYSAGRGRFARVQTARVRKTEWFRDDRKGFLMQLEDDITALAAWCARHGTKAAVRLNGTSDVEWETIFPMEKYPDVVFYDYTKIASRFARKLPANYHLTFSYSESSPRYAREVDKALRAGANLAVVFSGRPPATFKGLPVIDGDKNDLRFLETDQQVVVALTAKGQAKKDQSGFVIHPQAEPVRFVHAQPSALLQ